MSVPRWGIFVVANWRLQTSKHKLIFSTDGQIILHLVALNLKRMYVPVV